MMELEFHRLYELYFKDIYRYIYSKSHNESISEEIAQETFCRALEKIEDFDEKIDIRAWLFVVARNAYYSYCRKHKRITNEQELREVPDDINFVDQIIDRDVASQIRLFIEKMSETYRDVFTLRVYGELSFDEIGSLFGKSDVWARVTYYRAKSQIVEYMEAMKYE